MAEYSGKLIAQGVTGAIDYLSKTPSFSCQSFVFENECGSEGVAPALEQCFVKISGGVCALTPNGTDLVAEVKNCDIYVSF